MKVKYSGFITIKLQVRQTDVFNIAIHPQLDETPH